MNLARLGVRNPIAVNLLMWAILIGGFLSWGSLIRELFPNSEPEQVVIAVAYPGATPDEVEKSVALRIEREIAGVSGVEEVASEIVEGACAVRVTMEQGVERESVLNDLRNQIDRVTPDLPDGAEEPEIQALRPFFPVITVVVRGDIAEERLREVTESVRDDLLDMSQISEVTVAGTRDREIWAEIRPESLEEHGLTFEDVGRAVGAANLDLPGGQLEGPRGNVRVRTVGEDGRAEAIQEIVIRAAGDGTTLRLGDVARVRETFEDKIERGRLNGVPATTITVFKTPEQDAIEIADLVKDYVAENDGMLGGAVELQTINDLSRFVAQRLDLMVRNARAGLLLVCLTLALFLDLRVAFWVAIGLPVAFLGTFVAMKIMGLTVNLISLFGLIVVLGLIVDDAIVIGENVFTKIREGMPPAQAAIAGASEVSLPVFLAVTTTIIAFAPLAFLDGRIGTFLGQLPLVVIAALAVSLVEAFLILPAHLGHMKAAAPPRFARVTRVFDGLSLWRARMFEQRLPDLLERVLRVVLRWRYVSVAAVISGSLLVAGTVVGGIVPFVLMQQVDAENVTVALEMAAGTPVERTEETLDAIERLVLAEDEVATAFTLVGTSFSDRGRESAADPATVGQIQIEMRAADEREELGLRTSKEVVNELRRATVGLAGVAKLTFSERAGGPVGADIEIRVRNEDVANLEASVAHVRGVLGQYDGVSEIEDDLRRGKLEARLRLRDSARSLGITTRSLAQQTRHALFGFEAQDLQEEDGEVTVRVVLPEASRRTLADLGRLRIATPDGARVPLEEIASVTTERGYGSLARVDRKRAITIRASIDEASANISEVTEDVRSKLESIGEDFPGTTLTFEGRKKQTQESVGSLRFGFPLALLIIYALLATLFRSYMQPLLVMAAIPFALVGAVIGHMIMGYPFTLLSMIGGVALAGIVVNDSLILVDFINRRRREQNLDVQEAVIAGSRARMRAILLTSITTVAGLAPLMLETSFQAQFLIPMAVSIVFGLSAATVLTLIVLPTFYLIAEDARAAGRWLVTGDFHRDLPAAANDSV